MRKRFKKQGRSRSGTMRLPVIAPDGNEAILCSDADGKFSVRTQTTICDFCAAPNPTWVLPVGPVKLDGNPMMSHSDDDWAACDTCKPLIDARDIEALVERNLSEALRTVAVLGEMNAELKTLVPQEDALKKDVRVNFTRVFAAVQGPIYERV